MTKDELDKLKSGKKRLDEFFERFEELQLRIPKMQEIRDFMGWTIEAETSKPDEADEIPSPIFREAIDAELRFIEENVPILPKFDAQIYQGGTAANTTVSTNMYSYVSRVVDIPTDDARNYASVYSAKYHQLQMSYGRLDEIRSMLSKIPNSITLRRLDPAIKEFTSWKSSVGLRASAANAIRNLLHGLNGDLKNLAFAKTRKKESWERISAKLARGGPSSTDYIELLKQEVVHRRLVERLSSVSKDREGGSLTDLTAIWTETLDHIYIILNYIRIKTGIDAPSL